jgi:Zn-finger nucleic acid-binding protein
MLANEVEDDIAICPLCYCPYNPHIEECPECTLVLMNRGILPKVEEVNPVEEDSWFKRLSRSVSEHLPKSLFRSNEK